jgi:DNA repair exonuclease SbcCD nuclease subunit
MDDIRDRRTNVIRFLHSSDLHIGKPFGRFDEDLRARLREARYQKIAKLALIARENKATHILLAGDTFDAETPASHLLRQTIRALGAEQDITWVILPGNHDSLAASEIWGRFQRECPENVILALTAEVIPLGDSAMILPSPPPVRHPGRDLTEWMNDAETPDGCIRIGLAHGAIQGFSEADRPLGLIAPDRAKLANLDYMALGDWHGRLKISDRCHYSGAPEADNFKGHREACALLVEIDRKGAVPKVEEINTGDINWILSEIDFRPGDAPTDRLTDTLPKQGARRNTLVQMTASGRLNLSERALLIKTIADIQEDFGVFEDHENVDLDEIDPTSGALRQTAEALLAGANNTATDEVERRAASAALARLYGYALEAQA